MEAYQDIQARQIWADPGHPGPRCEGYRLPAPGIIILNESFTLTLQEQAVFQPTCSSIASSSATASANGTLPVYGLGDPFEGSVVPQMFVLGAMLVIAWSLVIILVITPRTSFVLGTGVGHLGRPNGNSATVLSIGGRPWLQKFAAISVGVSLFIATVNSFKIVEQQYNDGYQDALAVTNGVINSYEVRIMRVISTTFVWLAQIQTLIRLFPRHREKVIIKWAGFGLIVLDTLFVILDNFVSHGGNGPNSSEVRGSTEVIPVLSYLFELALNLLYAAWVFYYSFVKRRYAFFHPQMRNIAVVALMSYVSVFIPVIFFITDISKPQLASWGDYIRWVGSAAASVVVWEWVERIEALEREERKNGILGREIFDGDEVSGKSPSLSFPKWSRARSQKGRNDTSSSTGSGPQVTTDSRRPQRTRKVDVLQGVQLSNIRSPVADDQRIAPHHNGHRQSPLQTVRPAESPVPRSDTASAASTIYAVIHHPASTSTTLAQDTSHVRRIPAGSEIEDPSHPRTESLTTDQADTPAIRSPQQRPPHFLQTIGNPFKRRRSSPPPEVSRAAVDAAGRPSQARWSNKRSPKHIFRPGRPQVLPADLPIVVVPSQPRGHIWTPPVEDEEESHLEQVNQDLRTSENSSGHTPLSLNSSLQDSQFLTDRILHTTADRRSLDSPNNRGPEFLSLGHAVTGHPSDRGHSPRPVLPRVDEQIEQTESEGNHSASSHRADNSIPPIVPHNG